MSDRIFLDASFWIAYRDERQTLHDEAKRIFKEVFQHQVHFVTTLPVLCEIHAHFSRARIKKRAVLDDFFNNPVVDLPRTKGMIAIRPPPCSTVRRSVWFRVANV